MLMLALPRRQQGAPPAPVTSHNPLSLPAQAWPTLSGNLPPTLPGGL